MKAVITGSNGFIGSTLVDRLVNQGHDVTCLVRPASGVRESGPHFKREPIDFSRPETLENSSTLREADVVFHVGGVTKALTMEAFRAGNVAPTRLLLNTLGKVNPGLNRFVLVSSQAAAGPASSANAPMTEALPARPVDSYGQSKWEAEKLFSPSLPFPYTIVRPAAVYGPRDADFLQLFKQLKSRIGIYPGNRDSLLSTIHVDDLVSGIISAASNPGARHQTYYLTHEIAIPWSEVYRTIGNALERIYLEINVPFGVVALAARFGDLFSRLTGRVSILNSNKIDMAKPRYWICSSEKAVDEIGFSPQIPLNEGMQQTLEWYKEAGWI